MVDFAGVFILKGSWDLVARVINLNKVTIHTPSVRSVQSGSY